MLIKIHIEHWTTEIKHEWLKLYFNITNLKGYDCRREAFIRIRGGNDNADSREDQLAHLHRGQIDCRNYACHRLDIHLLLKIGLGLPGPAIDYQDALVPGDAHGMDMAAVQNGWRTGEDIMILMLRRDGDAAAVDR